MNQREVGEIRRRLTPEKSSVRKIYGCYINGKREIISRLEESVGGMSAEDSEAYFALLKKALSGTLGKNLTDVEFTAQQVMEGEEHRLLQALRTSMLEDDEAREKFYEKTAASLDMDGDNYLLMLAADAYDVPARAKDGAVMADASETMFTFVVCAVCPVTPAKSGLGYISEEDTFRTTGGSHLASPPVLGFLFPAFDDRATNIYNALYYTKDPAAQHQEFMDAVFHTEIPMTAVQQQENFKSVLEETLEDDCSYDVLQAVHEQIRERILAHKESHVPETPEITVGEVSSILSESGVPAEKTEAFRQKCSSAFGVAAPMNPGNLIDSGHFRVKTPQVQISIDPQYSALVKMQVINGRKYIMIPADEGVEVNGVEVRVPGGDDTGEGEQA